MILAYQSNCVYLYEPSLYKQLFPSTSFSYDPSQRLDLLHAFLLASQKLLDEYLQRERWTTYGTSVADMAPLGRGLTSLLKLCLIEEPGWDLNIVRQTANLDYYFEQLLSRFQQVGADLDGRQHAPCRQSFFTGCARAFHVFKNWYDTTIRSEAASTTLQEQASVMGYDVAMLGDQNFLDDAYWLEFMGDWTMQQ